MISDEAMQSYIGKANCPDSKEVDERIIEEAFVESYRLLCADNKAILETFLARVEKALRSESTEKKMVKLQDDERQISKKRKKLLDGFADGKIEKEVYSVNDSKGKLGKKSKLKDKELYSLSSDKAKDLCSNGSNYACGDCMPFVQTI